MHDSLFGGRRVGRHVLGDLGGAVAALHLHHLLFGGRRRRPARAQRLWRRGGGVALARRAVLARPRLIGTRGGDVHVLAPRAFWQAASSAGSSSTCRRLLGRRGGDDTLARPRWAYRRRLSNSAVLRGAWDFALSRAWLAYARRPGSGEPRARSPKTLVAACRARIPRRPGNGPRASLEPRADGHLLSGS